MVGGTLQRGKRGESRNEYGKETLCPLSSDRLGVGKDSYAPRREGGGDKKDPPRREEHRSSKDVGGRFARRESYGGQRQRGEGIQRKGNVVRARRRSSGPIGVITKLGRKKLSIAIFSKGE